MSHASLCWPECFAKNVTNFLDEPIENVLATQLCAWGNVYMGVPVPDNFFEVMDGCSKVTNVFTPEECKSLFQILMSDRKYSSDEE